MTGCSSCTGIQQYRNVSVLLFFLIFFTDGSLLKLASGASSPEGTPSSPVEEANNYVSNTSTWLFPEMENQDASTKRVTTWLASWCGDQWRDAVDGSYEKSKELDHLKHQQDLQSDELKRCQLEKLTGQDKLEQDCLKQQKLLDSGFIRERKLVQADNERERAELTTDLQSCHSKAKSRVEAVCDRDASVAQPATVLELSQVKASLQACAKQKSRCDTQNFAAREVELLRFEEERTAWVQECERLSVEVAECRPAKAKAEAELSAFNSDVHKKSLEKTVKWLGGTIIIMFLLITASSSAVMYFLFFEEKSGSVSIASRVAPVSSRLQLLSAEQARSELQDVYEKGSASGVPVILTASSEAEGGPAIVYILVPINAKSSRRFALFGGGGDYTGHLERAQEFVSKAAPKARHVIVLFEYGGCAFTEDTLKSLSMTADKVAEAAVPSDSDFPRRNDIVVLWLNRTEGLHVASSEGGSEFDASIIAEPWARYLLSRSGRWGDLSKS